MAMSKRDQLLRIKDEYRAAHENKPATTREMAEWAVANRKYKLRPFEAETKCAAELGDGLRMSYMTVQGRRVRIMHAYPSPQGDLWDDIRTVSRDNMKLSSQAGETASLQK